MHFVLLFVTEKSPNIPVNKLFRRSKIPDVYQINMLNSLIIMHDINMNLASYVSLSSFNKVNHIRLAFQTET